MAARTAASSKSLFSLCAECLRKVKKITNAFDDLVWTSNSETVCSCCSHCCEVGSFSRCFPSLVSGRWKANPPWGEAPPAAGSCGHPNPFVKCAFHVLDRGQHHKDPWHVPTCWTRLWGPVPIFAVRFFFFLSQNFGIFLCLEKGHLHCHRPHGDSNLVMSKAWWSNWNMVDDFHRFRGPASGHLFQATLDGGTDFLHQWRNPGSENGWKTPPFFLGSEFRSRVFFFFFFFLFSLFLVFICFYIVSEPPEVAGTPSVLCASSSTRSAAKTLRHCVFQTCYGASYDPGLAYLHSASIVYGPKLKGRLALSKLCINNPIRSDQILSVAYVQFLLHTFSNQQRYPRLILKKKTHTKQERNHCTSPSSLHIKA